MYDGPARGGTRGGADQFKWDDVKNDKYRECYLGHSVKAATGRWQKGKDIFWYSKSGSTLGLDEDMETLRREREEVKRQEQEMMRQALGLAAPDTERAELAPGEMRDLLRSSGEGGGSADAGIGRGGGGLGFGGAGGAGGGAARNAHGGVSFEQGERSLADVWRTGPAPAPAPPVAVRLDAGEPERPRSRDSSSSSSGSDSSTTDERASKRRASGAGEVEPSAGRRKHSSKRGRREGEPRGGREERERGVDKAHRKRKKGHRSTDKKAHKKSKHKSDKKSRRD